MPSFLVIGLFGSESLLRNPGSSVFVWDSWAKLAVDIGFLDLESWFSDADFRFLPLVSCNWTSDLESLVLDFLALASWLRVPAFDPLLQLLAMENIICSFGFLGSVPALTFLASGAWTP